MPDFTEICYVVDPHDTLVDVSPQWTEFALSNDGPEILPDQVVGRSLWDFIADDPTRDLYEAILDHVRSGDSTDLVLRCDGPERRRLIEMIVNRLPDGNVEFRTMLLSSKLRATQPLFARSTPRDGRQVMVCSWCDHVHIGADQWVEVEPAMEALELTGARELPRVEPVVCPECYAKVTEILARSSRLESI